MVEKFNFYDIYGYLMPGLVLTGLLWLPFGVLWHIWPKAEFSSAILVLLFAYVLGHVMQSLRVPTSEMQDKKGCWRHPSNVLLDHDNTALAVETKDKILALSEKYFEIDLRPKQNDPKDSLKHVDGRRESAFFQARSALLKNKGEKTSVYWEQFEGLYAMMRNIMLASAAGAFYFLGWSASYTSGLGRVLSPFWLLVALFSALFFSVARPPRKYAENGPSEGAAGPKHDKYLDKRINKSAEEIWNRRLAWGLAISLAMSAFLSGGLIARASTSVPHEGQKASVACCTPLLPGSADSDFKQGSQVQIALGHPAWLMFILALGAGVLSGRAYRAYKEFARQFALAIWRDFANFEVIPERRQIDK